MSKKGAIIRQLSSLENLANVNLLLTDKTGTLTGNKISVARVVPYRPYQPDDVLRMALAAAKESDTKDVIDKAIKDTAESADIKISYIFNNYVPADSQRKRATVYVRIDGEPVVISLGAAQVISNLLDKSENEVKRQALLVAEEAAQKGYRVLAVATSKGTSEHNLRLVGLLWLSDEARSSSKPVLTFMRNEGITTLMVTGDSLPIASRIANTVGIQGEIISSSKLSGQSNTTEWFTKYGGVAEALPQDKFKLVEMAKKQYVIAVTGDGVNDLPAISTADVGIAVANSVDALKSGADIVLTQMGLTAIKDAIIQARIIFARLYSYSVYRISESFRLIVSITILGLIYGTFPLTPVQLIMIAFLNDLPIISLAYDRVISPHRPSHINVHNRFIKSGLFGIVGVANSIILFVLMRNVLHLSVGMIETAFFLKLTVSGHMLIYVAHTEKRWWRFLPSKPVIIATALTQLAATAIALGGWLMPHLSISLAILVWIWALGWMQVSELTKWLQSVFEKRKTIQSTELQHS